MLMLYVDSDASGPLQPKLVCQVCHQIIAHHDEGLYRYQIPMDDDEPLEGRMFPIEIVHKGYCDRSTDKPPRVYWWGQLDDLVLFLRNYLDVDLDKTESRAGWWV